MDIIKDYLENNLSEILLECKLKSDVISIVTLDIKKRLLSIIKKWNDISFRQTLLTIGIEEATFYLPECELDIKALVVLAVRNSIIEDLSSTKEAARRYSLPKPVLNNNDIRKITYNAISFFSNVDLEKCSREITTVEENLFENLSIIYPVAWNAFLYLGNWSKQFDSYSSIIKPQLDFDSNITNVKDEDTIAVQVLSGMDPAIDFKLQAILIGIIKKEERIFFVDCLKMISRNLDKLFKVIEIVLRAEAILVTSNFYISNGYVAKRKDFLRPAHSIKDVTENLANNSGLRKTHLDALKIVKIRILE